MYQSSTAQLAPASGHFAQSVREAVELARGAPNLSPQERQLLDDLTRQEGRYQFRTLERLRLILRRLPTEQREEFPESIRASMTADGEDALPLAEALSAETRAEAVANPAQLDALIGPPSLEITEKAIATTRADLAAGRVLLASLLRERFRQLDRRHA
jgi:hypothetical protein